MLAIKNSSKLNKEKQSKGLKYDLIEINILNKQIHQSDDFGFTVAGYCPCHVEEIQENSIAFEAGLKKSDLIVKVDNVNCCRATLKTTLNLIKSSSTKSSSTLLTVYRLAGNQRKNQQKNKKQNVEKGKKIKRGLFNKLSTWCRFQLCSTASSSACNDSKSFYIQSKSLTLKSSSSSEIFNSGDTGYDSLSRQNSSVLKFLNSTIQTSTNTTDNYFDYDINIEESRQMKPLSSKIFHDEKLNEYKTHLIGNLIKMEDNFVSYLNNAVSTFVRPLRGFFMKQQDYFCLFQNIEKILVISENFLRSMDKWSAYDLYTRIGQLYTQKLNLFREAFTIYVKGYTKSKELLSELKLHSKQFRLFLKETQTKRLTVDNLLDLPIRYLNKTLNIFKEIKHLTVVSKRNINEIPHIDSVIFDLDNILSSFEDMKCEFSTFINESLSCFNNNDDDDDDKTPITFFTEIRSTVSKYSLSSSELSSYSSL